MDIKPIYDDFHKFLVSIGVISIIASALIFKSQNKKWPEIWYHVFDVFDTFLGLIGLFLIIGGIFIWYNKQKIIDISKKIEFINTLFKETSSKDKRKSLLKEKENSISDGLFILTKHLKYKRK